VSKAVEGATADDRVEPFTEKIWNEARQNADGSDMMIPVDPLYALAGESYDSFG
jgi:hypothetical protein